MSTLHKVKAYFGMAPMDDYDDEYYDDDRGAGRAGYSRRGERFAIGRNGNRLGTGRKRNRKKNKERESTSHATEPRKSKLNKFLGNTNLH